LISSLGKGAIHRWPAWFTTGSFAPALPVRRV
jgi:hypothetical protein